MNGNGAGTVCGDSRAESKRRAIRTMFNRVSARYDLLNRVLSLGMDGFWRKAAVDSMALRRGDRALDVACGTGDLTIEMARPSRGASAVGIDFASAMLEIGRAKCDALAAGGGTRFVSAAAEALPFPANRFSAAAIAFGIRNVPDRSRALTEMIRAVRPGGKVVVLELTTSSHGAASRAINLYVRSVLPLVGGTLSKGDAYRYLSLSMNSFPEPEAFVRELEEAGLESVTAKRMFLSPAWVFSGTVPAPGKAP